MLKGLLETVISVDRNRVWIRHTQCRRDHLFEAIQAEREADGWKIFSERRRQAIIAAAAGDLESEITHIGSEQDAGVIIESADLAQVNRQVLCKIKTFKDRIDMLEMIQSLNRSGIPHKLSRFLDNGSSSG